MREFLGSGVRSGWNVMGGRTVGWDGMGELFERICKRRRLDSRLHHVQIQCMPKC